MHAKRLHPAALIYFWYRSVREGLFYAFLIVIANLDRFFTPLFWIGFGALFALSILAAVLKYMKYTYELTSQEVVLNSGIFFHQHVHIAYNKIQTLQTRQWFYLRPFNLVSLQIETSGRADNKPEAVLPVISMNVVEEIRKRRSGGSQPFKEEQTISGKSNKNGYRINLRDLNLYALTSFGFFPFLVGLLAVFDRITDVVPEKYIDSAWGLLAQQGLAILIFILVLIVILAVGLSYLLIFNRYFHFSIETTDHRLVTSKGLLQKNNVTVATNKIQAVMITQTLLRQFLKLATVQTLLASQAANEEQGNDLVVIPVISQGKAINTTRQFVNWLPNKKGELKMIERPGRFRKFRNIFLPTLALVILLSILVRPYGLISLVLLPFAGMIGYYNGVNSGIAVGPKNVLIAKSARFFTRRIFLMPRAKIQSITMTQSVWMKNSKLTHITLSLRSGNAQQTVKVRYLPEQTAKQIYQWYRGNLEV